MSTRYFMRLSVCLLTLMLGGSASAATLGWKTLTEGASGPPYPSENQITFSLREGLLLPAVQRSIIAINLENILCDGSVRPASLIAGDDGTNGNPGARGAINLLLGDGSVNQGVTGGMLVAFGDGSVRQTARMQDFHFLPGGFEVSFDIIEGGGALQRHLWKGSIGGNQPFEFERIDAAVLGDGSVRLLFGLKKIAGDLLPASPVITMGMEAMLVPEPAGLALLAVSSLLLRRRGR